MKGKSSVTAFKRAEASRIKTKWDTLSEIYVGSVLNAF